MYMIISKKHSNIRSFHTFLVITVFTILNVNISLGTNYIQDDTLFVPVAETIPVIDGISNDECWSSTAWQTIDKVWIPLNAYVDSADFYGRFKIMWSHETNLLYLLAETVDDIWVDGYVFNQAGPGVHQYDVLELFFDEDRSGGLHLFDYFDDKGNPIANNSENAFAYHISVNVPDEGVPVNQFVVVDGDGTNWADYHSVNYASHFDSLSVRRQGNVTTWEMSIKVYNSSFDTNPAGARVNLTQGKISGFAVAYCDDDTPSNIDRQNFFGSVPPNLSYLDNNGDFNDCWINADHYGTIKLLPDETVSDIKEIETDQEMQARISPNPVHENIYIETYGSTDKESVVTLFDTSGNCIKQFTSMSNSFNFPMDEYPAGMYYISILQDVNLSVKKIVKTK